MADSLTLTSWIATYENGVTAEHVTEAAARQFAPDVVQRTETYHVGDKVNVHAFGGLREGTVTKLGKSRVTVHFVRNRSGGTSERAFAANEVWLVHCYESDESESEHASVEMIEAAIVAGERAAAAERDASWHDMRTHAERAATEPKLTGATGPRSEVRSEVEPADVRHPGGPVTVRHWTRVIGGVQHSFRAIVMPNGERRYEVTRYNGYGDDGTDAGRASGMRFGCAWSPAAFWKVPPPVGAAIGRIPSGAGTDICPECNAEVAGGQVDQPHAAPGGDGWTIGAICTGPADRQASRDLGRDDLEPDTDERGAELAALASERASHDAEQAAESAAWSALSTPDDCPSCAEGGEPDTCDDDCPTRSRATAGAGPTAEVLGLLAEIGYPDPSPEKLAELADSDPWGEGDVLRGATWGPAERIEIPAETLAELAEVLDPAVLACPECGEPAERAVIERAGWALMVPSERLQHVHRDDGTPLCPVMSADSGVVPALPAPRTEVAFSETDPATWSVPDPVRGTPYVVDNLPHGYEWREIDDSGELHLWSPDGRNVSAEYYASGAVPPPQGAGFLALALDRVAADLDDLSGEIAQRRGPIPACQWFALCDRQADSGTMAVPGLGEVPVCERCRGRAEHAAGRTLPGRPGADGYAERYPSR